MAKKIQLNSAYGAIGNQWFRYYDLRNAEAVTTGGQLAIRWIEKALNDYLNKQQMMILLLQAIYYISRMLKHYLK